MSRTSRRLQHSDSFYWDGSIQGYCLLQHTREQPCEHRQTPRSSQRTKLVWHGLTYVLRLNEAKQGVELQAVPAATRRWKWSTPRTLHTVMIIIIKTDRALFTRIFVEMYLYKILLGVGRWNTLCNRARDIWRWIAHAPLLKLSFNYILHMQHSSHTNPVLLLLAFLFVPSPTVIVNHRSHPCICRKTRTVSSSIPGWCGEHIRWGLCWPFMLDRRGNPPSSPLRPALHMRIKKEISPRRIKWN